MAQNSYSKMVSWMLLRLSGTEPLLRLYVEAGKRRCFAKLTREASQWYCKLKKKDANEKIQPFLRHYGPALLGLLMLVLVVHDIFGRTVNLAMRRTQQEIKKVNAGLDQLNKENFAARAGSARAQDRPHKIEKIAATSSAFAKPAKSSSKIPRSQQLPSDSTVKP